MLFCVRLCRYALYAQNCFTVCVNFLPFPSIIGLTHTSDLIVYVVVSLRTLCMHNMVVSSLPSVLH